MVAVQFGSAAFGQFFFFFLDQGINKINAANYLEHFVTNYGAELQRAAVFHIMVLCTLLFGTNHVKTHDTHVMGPSL